MEILDLKREFEDLKEFWAYIERRKELLRKFWDGEQWPIGGNGDDLTIHTS